MPTTLSAKTKHALAVPIQSWLRTNADGRQRLVNEGVSSSSLEKIIKGQCTDRFLFEFKDQIESITGLSIDVIFVSAAKRELWGDNDKFPSITSRSQLVSELSKKVEGRLFEVKRILHFDGAPSHFERDFTDPSKLWVGRIINCFHALDFLSGTSGSLPASVGNLEAVNENETAKSNNSQRTLDSIISMLNSLANMADANVDHNSVTEIAKINAAYAVDKLLKRIGVTPAMLKASKEKRGGSDTTNLQHVLQILGR